MTVCINTPTTTVSTVSATAMTVSMDYNRAEFALIRSNCELFPPQEHDHHSGATFEFACFLDLSNQWTVHVLRIHRKKRMAILCATSSTLDGAVQELLRKSARAAHQYVEAHGLLEEPPRISTRTARGRQDGKKGGKRNGRRGLSPVNDDGIEIVYADRDSSDSESSISGSDSGSESDSIVDDTDYDSDRVRRVSKGPGRNGMNGGIPRVPYPSQHPMLRPPVYAQPPPPFPSTGPASRGLSMPPPPPPGFRPQFHNSTEPSPPPGWAGKPKAGKVPEWPKPVSCYDMILSMTWQGQIINVFETCQAMVHSIKLAASRALANRPQFNESLAPVGMPPPPPPPPTRFASNFVIESICIGSEMYFIAEGRNDISALFNGMDGSQKIKVNMTVNKVSPVPAMMPPPPPPPSQGD